MKLGVFGGTFNPVHNGHLALAEAALCAFGLDRVLFVPGHVTPFKQDRPAAPDADRLAMLRLALQNRPRMDISTVELDRGGVSYTVDTLETLRATHPGDELWLLLGLDSLLSFGHWYRARDILDLATVATLLRPGSSLPDGPLAGFDTAQSDSLRAHVANGDCPDISSTEVRRRIAAGESTAGLLPDSVAEYIRAHGLYATPEFPRCFAAAWNGQKEGRKLVACTMPTVGRRGRARRRRSRGRQRAERADSPDGEAGGGREPFH